jgi:hypothetical protein
VDKVSERITSDGTRTPYFNNYVTNTYKLSCFKSVTNKTFVLSTRIDNLNYSEILKQFYETLYVECVAKNVLCSVIDPIHLPSFKTKVRDFFQKYTKAIQNKP